MYTSFVRGEYAAGCQSLPPGDAGQMSATVLTICEGQTAQATPPTGVNLDGNDAGAYILQNLGSASLGQILAENTTGIFPFLPGTMTYGTQYFISYLVGNDTLGLPNLNDPCLSVNAGQPVIFYQNPIANAGIDQTLCGNSVSFSANQLGQGNWTVFSKPLGATANFANPTAATTSATVSTTGVFEFQWEISQNGCKNADLVKITFTDAPMAGPVQKKCNASATQYDLTFDISGGTAPYIITGINGQLVGNQFTSIFLTNNASYSITISDATGCTSVINGSFSCDCTQSAGNMSQTPISVCEGNLANGIFLGGNIQNLGDTLFYILHDGASTNIGTIFQSSPKPEFSFQPPLIFGKTYFISAVVTSVLPNGQPDFNSACLDLAQGQPVVFHPKPSATLAGDATICLGDAANLTFNCLGDGPFSVVYSDGTQNFTQTVGTSGVFSKNISPTISTTYTLISVNDSNSPACSTNLTGKVTVAVGQPASANIKPKFEVCNNPLFGSIVDFSTLILSGDATGNWVDFDNSGATGSFPVLNFDGLAAGVYVFKYTTAAAQAPCPQQTYSVALTVKDCQCPSVETSAPAPICNSAGPFNLQSITVTPAPGVWTITNAPTGSTAVISGNNLNITGSLPGNYELTFTLNPLPQLGCPTNSVEILKVEKAVSAGVAGAAAEFCRGEDWAIDLFSLFDTAPDLGGNWTETSVVPTPSGAFSVATATVFTKNLPAGMFKFKYKIAGTAPCPSDEQTVLIIIHPDPIAQAGTDATLDCFGTPVNLGGPGTSTGNGYSYFWQKDGQPLSGANQPNLSVTQPGNYRLEVVEVPLGCKKTDDVEVTQSVAANGLFPKIIPILCANQSTGTISLDSIVGGSPPFLFSLNGSAFSNQSIWTGLAAGTYEIKIQDVKGCEATETVEILAPMGLTVNLGPDLLINLGDSLTVLAQVQAGISPIDTLIWTPLLNLSQAGQPLQSFRPLRSQNLTLTAVDENGCRETNQIFIEVDKTRHVFVPNAFQPESGSNGFFTIYGGQDVVKIKSFKVFDRWGDLVFSNQNFLPNDPTLGWDGVSKGKKMAPMVFVWWAEVLFVDGETKIYKGDVTIGK